MIFLCGAINCRLESRRAGDTSLDGKVVINLPHFFLMACNTRDDGAILGREDPGCAHWADRRTLDLSTART